MGKPRVAVLMGSDSDWPVMESCVKQLTDLGIEAEVKVLSAHRTPQLVHQFAESAKEQGFEVIIAGAGMAAALAGCVAAATRLPVIGVPLASGALQGVDALLSTVQMPPGVPVAAVGIGSAGARNAAILAAQIIARANPEVDGALARFEKEQADSVLRKGEALRNQISGGS